VQWGKAEWSGALDARSVRPHSLVLRRPGGELWIDGTLQTGDFGEDDAVDARVRIVDWPAADLVKALEWDVDVQGLVSGEVALAGRRSDPHGTVHLTSPSGHYYGVPYEAAEVRSELRGRVTEVKQGRARVAGGALDFAGTVTDDGIYDGRARVEDVDLAAMAPAAAASLKWSGRVSGAVTLQGPLARPRLEGELRSPRVFLADEGLGALEGRV